MFSFLMFSLSFLPSQFLVNWWHPVSGPEILRGWLAPTIPCSLCSQHLSYCPGIACLSLSCWLLKGREPVFSTTVSWAPCLTQHRPQLISWWRRCCFETQTRRTGPPYLISILQSLISTSFMSWIASHITSTIPTTQMLPIVLAPLSLLGAWLAFYL